MVKLLLDSGADVNAKGGQYGKALQVAVSLGCETSTRRLLGAGTEINAEGGLYDTALCAAVTGMSWAKPTLLQLLLDAGAGANLKAPVVLAARIAPKEFVTILLQAGADVNVKDQDSITALLAAIKVGKENIVSVLLGAGADTEGAREINDADTDMGRASLRARIAIAVSEAESERTYYSPGWKPPFRDYDDPPEAPAGIEAVQEAS